MLWFLLIAFVISVLGLELALPTGFTVLFVAAMAACAALAITCPRKRDDAVFYAHVL